MKGPIGKRISVIIIVVPFVTAATAAAAADEYDAGQGEESTPTSPQPYHHPVDGVRLEA
jgi:hypothetical protein